MLFGSQKEELDYKFIQEDNYYSFRATFTSKAAPDCLIDLIYNFKNIPAYASGAKSIDLGPQGENWYEVTFTYRKLLIFENRSTWRRSLKRDKHIIIFDMISNRNNIGIVPEMLSSTGYYRIWPKGEGCLVEYFQECRLKPGPLKEIYINRAKKEAIKFLQVFKKFIDRICE